MATIKTRLNALRYLSIISPTEPASLISLKENGVSLNDLSIKLAIPSPIHTADTVTIPASLFLKSNAKERVNNIIR